MPWRALAEALSYFVFLYPLAMSMVWVVGGLDFWRRRERSPDADRARWPSSWPPVTILVPCHNEEAVAAAACEGLRRLDYPDYRVIFIDDASSDRTAEIIRGYLAEVPRFHLLRLERNRGKAGALNAALEFVKTPLVMVQDADTRLDGEALKWLAAPFLRQPRLGAVTANPVPCNRRGFWGSFQAAEFASIIGLIKRSQRVLGRMLTVSGCAAMYRTDVLRRVGGFSEATATEDIDVTWRIQKAFFEVWFEPRALAWIQVPTRFRELWRQRKRWALGGWHLLRTHRDVFSDWRWRRLWPVYAEFAAGCVWAFAFAGSALLWAASAALGLSLFGASPFPAWQGAVASTVCLVQMAAAVAANRRHDPGLPASLFWAPWYPLAFFFSAAFPSRPGRFAGKGRGSLKLPVSHLAPGMTLARPVYGPRGELLLSRGAALSARRIAALREAGVLAVHVEGPVPEAELENAERALQEELRAHTMNVVRSWAEHGAKRVNFASVVEQVRSVVDEILSGKTPMGGLAEISSADAYTFAHSVDVCVLSVAAGARLGYGREKLLKLGVGALLHDLGKTKVPPEILNKPRRLTPAEFAEIRKHPAWGYKLLLEDADGDVDPASAMVVLNHHERFDGSGYPRGLAGADAGEMAMICAAADMYNAMTTDRVYRRALPPHEAYEMLMGAGGSLLPFGVVRAFLSCVEPYPVGSVIRLSTGDVACVVSADPELPFRPTVVLIPSGETVDLRRELSVTIAGPLPASEARRFILGAAGEPRAAARAG